MFGHGKRECGGVLLESCKHNPFTIIEREWANAEEIKSH